jgi:hypothetical protein
MPFDGNSPVRAELIALSEAILSATGERDEAQAAYDRLEKPAHQLTEAMQEYATEKALYDGRIVAWYEGSCPGARPEPTIRMLELDRKLGELRRDIGASDGALASARSALDAANVRRGELQQRHASAMHRTVVEVAREHLEHRCIPAMVNSLTLRQRPTDPAIGDHPRRQHRVAHPGKRRRFGAAARHHCRLVAVPSHFGSIFLTENYIVLQCDGSTWDDHGAGQGSYKYLAYWEGGIPGRGRLLMRVLADQAHLFPRNGGFSRAEDL